MFRFQGLSEKILGNVAKDSENVRENSVEYSRRFQGMFEKILVNIRKDSGECSKRFRGIFIQEDSSKYPRRFRRIFEKIPEVFERIVGMLLKILENAMKGSRKCLRRFQGIYIWIYFVKSCLFLLNFTVKLVQAKIILLLFPH